MKILRFFFIKVPRKIYFVLRYKCEHVYYSYIYSNPELKTEFVARRYLLFGGISLKNASEIYHQLFLHQEENIVKEANKICDHIFDLLGSGSKLLSAEGKGYQNIDWHIDFKSRYRWDPKIFYRYISFGHKEGVDIKVPFELSRFQHLNTLGQAHILTGNKKYSDEFVNQINDWIDNNPFCYGVNWNCAMDVSIRSVNWLVAMEYFLEDNILPRTFLNKLYASILEHGRFIRSHLEYASGWTTNHFLADIAGLFFIAVYCPFFKESSQWRDFALKALCKEIEKQVYPDGCSFEASTSYHRLALEMFYYSGLLGQRAGIDFPESYIDRVRKMFEVSLYCIKPNGMIPQIGDNDNGRFLKFSNRHILNHTYLLSLAAVHLNDGAFKVSGFELDEEAFWVFGEHAGNLWKNLPVRESLNGFKSFPDTGWYVIRNKNDYCMISCGPNGGDGWHSHNDKLSFELMIDGKDIIVDPGTYVYTAYPDQRNKFRSTEYHNTVAFNVYEQNDIPEKVMFSLPDSVNILNVNLYENNEFIEFEGEIQYSGIFHSRKIVLNKNTHRWKIDDVFTGPKETQAKLMFHLSPDVTYEAGCLSTRDSNEHIASIEVEGLELTKTAYEYSPEYGVKAEAENLMAYIPVSGTKQKMTTTIVRM